MPHVESEAIESIGYRHEQRQLFVTFTTGRKYVYFDVPASTYREFLEAESHGRYFNAHIRDHYAYREIT